MKFAIFALLLCAAAARPEDHELPEQANPNAHRVGSIKLTKDAEVEFLAINDALVVSASIPRDDEDTLALLDEAEKEAAGDPVKFFEMLDNGAGNSGNAPPGLVKKWQDVQEIRQNEPQGPPPDPPSDEEQGGGRRGLRGLGVWVRTGDWWTDNYCAEFRLQRNGCECYKWQTGNRSPSHNYIWGEELKINIYPYIAPTGGVGRRIKQWKNNNGSWGWETVISGYVREGYVGWMHAWGPFAYYGGEVYVATGDWYYWSLYEIDNSICNPPPGVWQSW